MRNWLTPLGRVLFAGLAIVAGLLLFLFLPDNSEEYLRKALYEKGASSVADFKIADTNGVFRNVDRSFTKYFFDLFIAGSEPTNFVVGIGSTYSIKIKMISGAKYSARLKYDVNSGIMTIALPPKYFGLVDEEAYIARKLTTPEETQRVFKKTVNQLGLHDF